MNLPSHPTRSTRSRILVIVAAALVALVLAVVPARAQLPAPVADEPLPYQQAPLPTLSALAEAEARSLDAWVAKIEGGWAGENNQTPMGRMPFALLFDRQEDGSLYTHAALNRDTWIDLRFIKDGSGHWLLQEGGALEGLGERGSVLIPAKGEGELRRWTHPENPDYLTVEMSVDEETLYMNVMVLGREHASFRMARVEGEDLVAMRTEFEAGSRRSPEEASIYSIVGGGEIPEAILLARAKAATHPENARAHLGLAQATASLIQADRSQAPRYAHEMLQSLQTAMELDPTIPEVYEYLGGYYLNAPPIAGGSVEKAEQMAIKLSEIDAARGERLLAQVRSQQPAPH